ncbi:hypothetical protein EDB85DRAFT_1888663 [Lactarius pseudohatsudake]|nr:hypothetical protein EDB85DRAFT_1888663 [Lactarius pseudohatsudake]
MSLGAGDASPAPHCPRTQGEGRRAHPVPSAWAMLAPPHTHHTAPPVHARGGVSIQPLRTGHSGPVFMRPAIPADAGGSVRPAASAQGAPPGSCPGGATCEGAAREHTHMQRVTERGTIQPRGANRGAAQRVCGQGEAQRGATRVPGGAACEQRGVRIGVEV